MSRQYQIIQRVRYERNLLDMACALSADGRDITLDGIQQIYQKALDGHRITDTERRTLLYIGRQFSLHPDAQDWLNAQLQPPPADLDNPYEAILKRVIRNEYRLMNLGWQVDPAEAGRQEALGHPRLFENALRGALKAFLNWNMWQLSFGAFVNRFHDNETYPTPEALLRAHLDRGTLFLVPLDAAGQPSSSLAHAVPEGLDTAQNWVFGLYVPKFFPALFLAHMRRDQLDQQYSDGYISRKPPLPDLTTDIVGRLLDNPGTTVSIDPEELGRQLAYLPGQNFGNALFAALHGGIYNGESSMSFRDFIQQEIWPDPECDLREHMRDYLNDGGKISLLPAGLREGNAFGISPDMIYWDQKEWWLFVVEMPRRTHIKAIINTPRDNHDGETAWNDCFQPADSRPLEERLQDVLTQEFGLPGLALQFPEDEYEAQRTQFGPDWRHPQGLLRQALNTILNDYLEPRSVFHVVAQVHNMHPGDHPSLRAFRDAVRTRIHGYLQSATLELLPIELPDNNPVDTEPIDQFWEFFLRLPGLSDHGFWVIIPRWPEEDQRPYVYGAN